jgi:hypothetical protein
MPEVITPNEIDGKFVPRPRPDLVEIQVGPETVLLGRKPYALNGTAALVWKCFDGEVTIDELIAEVTAATGVDEATIGSDVRALTRSLASLGMLEGVEPGSRSASKPARRGVEVGAEFEPFLLPDLDGNETSWDSFRGRQVLLVNWSAGCGYCTRIADGLAALQRPLEERGVSLVFLVRGSADGNRALFEKHGIGAPALLAGRGGPFAGFGTPAAYLVDGEGKVAAPFAYGALEVPELAREAAGLGDEGALTGAPSPALYLPVGPAVCGGDGPDGSDGFKWTGTATYRLGEFHVGIRYNAESSAETLDRLFPGLRVEDSRAPDNYSVVLQDSLNRTREFNLLLQGPKYLVRSRTRARVLRGLLNYLSAELSPPEQPLLGLRTSAVVHNGRAIILPASVSNWINVVQPRLNRLGIQIVDLPWLLIDPAAAEMVVPEPLVDYDHGVLDELDGADGLGSELPPVLPGRYPLQALVVPGDVEGPLSSARGLVEAVPLLMVPHDNVEEAAQALVRLFEKVEPTGAWLDRPAVLTEFLQRAI